MTIRTIIDIHALQTVPPNNINRDDTGSPKTAIYGGTRRARVSSQAWKRAIRTSFGEHLDTTNVGVRTKKIVELVAKEIAAYDQGFSSQAEKLAEGVLQVAGIKVAKPKKSVDGAPAEAGYLLFLSHYQAVNLARLAVD